MPRSEEVGVQLLPSGVAIFWTFVFGRYDQERSVEELSEIKKGDSLCLSYVEETAPL